MNLDLTGKRALVTGSTRGIGYATARGLAEMGATVVVNGRTQNSVDAAIAKLRAERPKARIEGAPGDLGTAEGSNAVIAARRPSFRRPPVARTGSRCGPNDFHASEYHANVLGDTFLRYFRSST